MSTTEFSHSASALGDLLRQAVHSSGRSRNSIAVQAGISPIVLSRFVRGRRDLTLKTASKLARVLGITFAAVVTPASGESEESGGQRDEGPGPERRASPGPGPQRRETQEWSTVVVAGLGS
jgi:transcriptional regulator with XRE-family HTH domain